MLLEHTKWAPTASHEKGSNETPANKVKPMSKVIVCHNGAPTRKTRLI